MSEMVDNGTVGQGGGGTPDVGGVPAVALGSSNGGVNIGAPVAAPTPTPNPETGMAQHIMSALGGSGGQPGDWAKAVLAGNLTSTAFEGSPLADMPDTSKMPAGANPVAFALGETMKNRNERMRLARSEAAQRQQQQFENQLKVKQDQRSDLELQNNTKRTDAEVAMYNANRIRAEHEDARAEKMAPYMEEEAKQNLHNVQMAGAKADQDFKSVLISAGMKPEDVDRELDHWSQVTPADIKAAATGQNIIVHSDNGVHLASGAADLWNSKTDKDTEVISGYDFDKKGNPVPKKVTVSAGTSIGTIAAMYESAQQSLQQKTKQLSDAAELRLKNAQIDEAQTTAALRRKQMEDPSNLTPQERAHINMANLKQVQDLSVKGKDSYATFSAVNNDLRSTIKAGVQGDMFAQQLAKTMGIMNVNNIADLSRISPQEYAAMHEAGTYYQQAAAYISKNVRGTLTTDQAKYLQALADRASDAKYGAYLASVKSIAEESTGDFKNPTVMAPDGRSTMKFEQAWKEHGTNETGGNAKNEAYKVHNNMEDFKQSKAIGGQVYYSDDNHNWFDSKGNMVK